MEDKPLRRYRWTVGTLLVGSTLLGGCWWNKSQTVPSESPAAVSAANAPLNDAKYGQLVEQFNGSGDEFEKKTRALEEESWTDALKKTGSSIVAAIKPKPKVTPAADPVSLASGIPELGPDVYFHAGQMAEERKNPEEALRQYAKSLEKDPRYLPALIASARLLERLGKREEAARVYQEAMRLHPDSPTPYNDLGLSLLNRRQWEAAEAAFRQAVERAPKDARYRNNLARALVGAGRTPEALKVLQEALAPAAAHYNLAYLLRQSGQAEEARRYLEQALKLDPNLEPARRLLAKLPAVPRRPAAHVATAPPATLVKQSPATSPAPAAPASLRLPASVAPRSPATPNSEGAPKRLPTVQ